MNPDRYIQALGKAIRDHRRELGYSQEAFADIVGLHRTYIGSIERGETNLTIKTLIKITKKLKTTIAKITESIEAER